LLNLSASKLARANIHRKSSSKLPQSKCQPQQLTHYEERLVQWLNLRSEENSGT
jgi:hypothetical protein